MNENPFLITDEDQASNPFKITAEDDFVDSSKVLTTNTTNDLGETTLAGSAVKGFKRTQSGFNLRQAEAETTEADIYSRIAAGEDPKDIYSEEKRKNPSKWKGFGIPTWINMDQQSAASWAKMYQDRAAGNIGEAQEAIEVMQGIPGNKALEKLVNSETWSEVYDNATLEGVVHGISESLGGQAPTMPLLLLGLAGPGAMAAGQFASAFATEQAATPLEVLTALGVDPKDTAEVTKTIASPMYKELLAKKLPKSVVVAMFEGLGGYIAGAKLNGKPLRNMVVQATAGSATGVAGEGLGSLAIGEIAKPGELAMEGLAEGIMQVPESAITATKAAGKREKQETDLTGLENDLKAKEEVTPVEDTKTAPEPSPEASEGKLAPQKAVLLGGDPTKREVIDNTAKRAALLRARQDQQDTAPVISSVDVVAAQQIQAEHTMLTDETVGAMYEALFQDEQKAQRLSWMGDAHDTDSTEYSSAFTAATQSLSVTPSPAVDLVPNLMVNAPNKHYAAIAERAYSAIEALTKVGNEIEVRVIKDKQAREAGWQDYEKARYTRDGDYTIIEYRSSPNPGNNGLNFQTVLHELIHAATATQLQAFRDNPALAHQMPEVAKSLEDLQQIITDVKKAAQEAASKGEYLPEIIDEAMAEGNNVLENEDEILAWGLTNPEVQDWLRKTKFGGEKRSFADRLFMALKNLFRIPRNDESTLSRLLGIYSDITSPPVIEEITKLPSTEALLAMKQRVSPLSVHDVQTARHSFEQEQLFLSGLAGIDGPYNPYQKDFGYLQKLATDKKVPIVNIDNENAFFSALNAGTPANIRPGNKVGPYTFFPNKKGTPAVAVAIDNVGLITRLKAQFPNYEILTPSEAEYFVRTGQTGLEAYADWRKRVDAQNSLDALGRINGRLKKEVETKLGKLAPLENIEDVQVAKHELLNNSGDLKQNFTDILSSGPQTKATLTNNPMIKWLRGKVRAGIRAGQDMNRTMIEPIVHSYHKLTTKQQVAVMQALLMGDKYQVDLDEATLKARGFNADQINVIMRFYEADRQLFNKNNQNRAKFGMEPITRRQGHFPGIFNDEYSTIAYDGNDIVGIVGAKTRAGVELHKKAMNKAAGKPLRYTTVKRRPLEGNPDSTLPLGMFYDNLESIIGKVPAAQKDTAHIVAQQFLGFHKFDKDKKGVLGNIGNKPWKDAEANAKEQFLGMLAYLQDGAFHHEMMPHIKELYDMASDPDIIHRRPRTAKYLNGYFMTLTRRNPRKGLEHDWLKPFAKAGDTIDAFLDIPLKLTGLPRSVVTESSAFLRESFALMAMSIGNIAFMALQFSQVPISGLPMAAYLRQKVGANILQSRAAPLSAVAQTIKAYALTRQSDFHKSTVFKNMDKEEQMLLQFVVDNNLIDFGTLENQKRMLDVDAPLNKGMAVIDFTRKFPEQTTRPYAFYWFYNILKDNGIPMKQAMEVALNATQNAMVDYHQTNRPMVYSALGQVGRLIGQLKTFMHGFVSQQMFYAQNPKALATFLGIYLAFAGVEGLLGYEEANEVFRQFNAKFNDNPDMDLKTVLRPYMPDLVRHGLVTEMTGYDVYSRVRMPQIVSTDTITPAALAWLTKAGVNLSAWAKDTDSETKKKNAVRELLPSSVRAIGADQWARTDENGNLLDKSGNIIFYNYDWSIMRRMGFKKPEETEAWDRYIRRKDTEKRRFEQMREISKEIELAVKERRSLLDPYIQEKIREYTALGGNAKSLLGKARMKEITTEQRMTIEQRGVGGVNPTPATGALQEFLRERGR